MFSAIGRIMMSLYTAKRWSFRKDPVKALGTHTILFQLDSPLPASPWQAQDEPDDRPRRPFAAISPACTLPASPMASPRRPNQHPSLNRRVHRKHANKKSHRGQGIKVRGRKLWDQRAARVERGWPRWWERVRARIICNWRFGIRGDGAVGSPRQRVFIRVGDISYQQEQQDPEHG
jgi:hypothetical protein